jgi:hypothetical protein
VNFAEVGHSPTRHVCKNRARRADALRFNVPPLRAHPRRSADAASAAPSSSWIAASSSFGSIGFARCRSKPDASARSTFSGVAHAVSATAGQHPPLGDRAQAVERLVAIVLRVAGVDEPHVGRSRPAAAPRGLALAGR